MCYNPGRKLQGYHCYIDYICLCDQVTFPDEESNGPICGAHKYAEAVPRAYISIELWKGLTSPKGAGFALPKYHC